MKSTYDEMKQLDLDVLQQRQAGRPVLVSMRHIYSIKSLRHAYRKCIAMADMQEEEVANYLAINATQFSKILNGNGKNLDDNKVELLEVVCSNKVISQYLAYRDGYELVSIESDLERENRLLKEQLAAERHDNETIRNFLNLKVVASSNG